MVKFPTKRIVLKVLLVASVLLAIGFILPTLLKSPNRKLLESAYQGLHLKRPDETGALDGCRKDLYGQNSCSYYLSYYFKDAGYQQAIKDTLVREGWKATLDESGDPATYTKMSGGQLICASIGSSELEIRGGTARSALGLSTGTADCSR